MVDENLEPTGEFFLKTQYTEVQHIKTQVTKKNIREM